MNADRLAEVIPNLGISGKKLSTMSDRLNWNIHHLVRDLKLLKVKRDAKRRNPSIYFQKDIEQAARNLTELINKAPEPMCNNPKFEPVLDELERLPILFSDIQSDPDLAQYDLEDPYAGKKSVLRTKFVVDTQVIYQHFTGKKDWIYRSYRENKLYPNTLYPNTFFQLIKLTYECAGLSHGESTIRDDITRAKKGEVIPKTAN